MGNFLPQALRRLINLKEPDAALAAHATGQLSHLAEDHGRMHSALWIPSHSISSLPIFIHGISQLSQFFQVGNHSARLFSNHAEVTCSKLSTSSIDFLCSQ